ncbi:hypothetical protein MGN01_29810 [Methylobacterium gnaphalii]|uniref:Uncharacterized protein n=1 Tax=Methylobacterium gnaphalii TaxID=1010610 RepID=A0A512JMD3_9HYPH|nr:hypothetical protein MGN01_29810 [Methylobacterium gnaphalii]GLS49641.1 hypothetical protein GCM10007885_24910 [Methylobacterium gnaphalii]
MSKFIPQDRTQIVEALQHCERAREAIGSGGSLEARVLLDMILLQLRRDERGAASVATAREMAEAVNPCTGAPGAPDATEPAPLADEGRL